MGLKLSKLKALLKPPIQQAVRRIFRMDAGYEFKPARSIREQSIRCEYKGRCLTFTADHATPLYETIGEIVDSDCYQLDRLDFSKSSDAIILDVGGHIGTASVVLSVLHAGKIIALEPLSKNCEMMKRNLEINGVRNVMVIPAALSDQDELVRFAVDPDSSVAGHKAGIMAANPHTFSQAIEVRGISLKSILSEFPNTDIHLIKADCEGGEYGLVDQLVASPELARRVLNLTFEVHDLDRARHVGALTKQLQGMGYKVRYKAELHKRFGLHHLLASR